MLGYAGGMADAVFRRIVDVAITIPFLVLVIAIVAVLGPGLRNMYIAISAVNWIIYARLMRGEVLAQAQRDYAAAGRVMGYGPCRIIFRHLLPNAISPGPGLLDDGHGAGDPARLQPRLSRPGRAAADAEWGVLIADGKNFMTTAWWMSIFPGIAIVLAGHRVQPARRRAGRAGAAAR